jgi:hypothetical protein
VILRFFKGLGFGAPNLAAAGSAVGSAGVSPALAAAKPMRAFATRVNGESARSQAARQRIRLARLGVSMQIHLSNSGAPLRALSAPRTERGPDRTFPVGRPDRVRRTSPGVGMTTVRTSGHSSPVFLKSQNFPPQMQKHGPDLRQSFVRPRLSCGKAEASKATSHGLRLQRERGSGRLHHEGVAGANGAL